MTNKGLLQQLDGVKNVLENQIKLVEMTSTSVTVGPNTGTSINRPVPNVAGYNNTSCIALRCNNNIGVIPYNNGWLYNATSSSKTITVTYLWILTKK